VWANRDFRGLDQVRKRGKSLTTMFAKHYLVSSGERVHSAKMPEMALLRDT
jgi:hypothetical protein